MTHSWGEYHRGCRCDFCMKRRLRADKKRVMYGHNLTDASYAQSAFAKLIAEGFTLGTISVAVKMSRTALADLPARKRVRKETDTRFRALTRQGLIAATPDGGEVPAVGVYRRVRAMLRLGWTRDGMARSRAEWATLRAVLDGRQHRVKAGLHRHIQALYDERSMTLGPHKANRTLFARLGYPPPLAWDDETIDDPATQPQLDGPAGDNERGVLYGQGMSDRQIAWELGLTPDSVRLWRTRSGLPPNFQRGGKRVAS